MTFIPQILASASNAPKQTHCQTGKCSNVQKSDQFFFPMRVTMRLRPLRVR